MIIMATLQLEERTEGVEVFFNAADRVKCAHCAAIIDGPGYKIGSLAYHSKAESEYDREFILGQS